MRDHLVLDKEDPLKIKVGEHIIHVVRYHQFLPPYRWAAADFGGTIRRT